MNALKEMVSLISASMVWVMVVVCAHTLNKLGHPIVGLGALLLGFINVAISIKYLDKCILYQSLKNSMNNSHKTALIGDFFEHKDSTYKITNVEVTDPDILGRIEIKMSACL